MVLVTLIQRADSFTMTCRAQGGKRERDMKEKIARDPPARDAKREPSGGSTSAAQFAYVDPDLNWEDIAWIRKIAPGKPIVIKGISCVEVSVDPGRTRRRFVCCDRLTWLGGLWKTGRRVGFGAWM